MVQLAHDLSSTVIFLFEEEGDDPIGTAFIVSYPIPGESGSYVPLVVTAKHVVGDHEVVKGRFTQKSGISPAFIRYPLGTLRRAGDVWEHPEEGVDIVVFRIPEFEKLEYRAIPIGAIASREIYQGEDINATDRIVFPCMLTNFMGTTRNYPVIRDGCIALIPDEPVPVKIEYGAKCILSDQEVILIDATSIQGASGSPIFLWPGPRLKHGAFDVKGGTAWLLGVMHGFYLAEPREVVGRRASWIDVEFEENTGIAIVFPSWRLLEILGSEGLKERIRKVARDTN